MLRPCRANIIDRHSWSPESHVAQHGSCYLTRLADLDMSRCCARTCLSIRLSSHRSFWALSVSCIHFIINSSCSFYNICVVHFCGPGVREHVRENVSAGRTLGRNNRIYPNFKNTLYAKYYNVFWCHSNSAVRKTLNMADSHVIGDHIKEADSYCRYCI